MQLTELKADKFFMEESKAWYALYTMPRSEKKVEYRLKENGFDVYLPLIPSIRIWSDRKKKITLPLIPGFVFVYSTEHSVKDSLHVKGALGIIRHLGKPARIRDYEINNLHILLKEPAYINKLEQTPVNEGEDIEVMRGPFIGLTGKCIRSQGKCRVIVQMKALGSSIEVSVPQAFLRKKLTC